MPGRLGPGTQVATNLSWPYWSPQPKCLLLRLILTKPFFSSVDVPSPSVAGKPLLPPHNPGIQAPFVGLSPNKGRPQGTSSHQIRAQAFWERQAEPLRDARWPEIRSPSLASRFPREPAPTADGERGAVSATSRLPRPLFFPGCGRQRVKSHRADALTPG